MPPRSAFTKLRRHAGQVIFHLVYLGSVKVSFCWKVKCMADTFGCVAGWQLQVAAPCLHGRLGKGIASLRMSAKGPIPSPSGLAFPTAATQDHREACFSDGPPPSDNFFGAGRLGVNLNEVCSRNLPPQEHAAKPWWPGFRSGPAKGCWGPASSPGASNTEGAAMAGWRRSILRRASKSQDCVLASVHTNFFQDLREIGRAMRICRQE